MKRSLAAAALLLSGLVGASRAQPVTIDFESFALGGQTFLDVAEFLPFNNVGGSGVNVTIIGAADNRIYDVFKYGNNPAAIGQALIDWPWPAGSNLTGTTFLFEPAIHDFSVRVGDFGGDDDSPATITAFDAFGNVLGTASAPWAAMQNPPFATLSLSVAGIRKVVFQSGGSYANSMFIDDVTFMGAPTCATPAATASYGTGKPGTNGIPLLFSTSLPKIGASSDLTVTNGLAGAPALLLFGTAQTALPFDQGTLLVVPSVALSFSMDGSGGFTLPVAIPAVPALCALSSVFFQVLIADPGAAGHYGTAQTAGLQWTLGS